MRATRMLMCVGVLLAAADLALFKSSHLYLAVGLATGEIDGRPIPMEDFSPAQFTGKTTTLRCGSLLLDLPQDAQVEPQADEFLLCVRFAGAACHIFAPMHDSGTEEDFLRDAEWALPYGNDEMARRIALYRSNSDQFSFWTSTSEAESLLERLLVRRVFCSWADRIEVLRGTTVSGFLFLETVEGTRYMELDYFCQKPSLRGRVFITVDPAQPGAMEQARALLSSFRIDGGFSTEQLARTGP